MLTSESDKPSELRLGLIDIDMQLRRIGEAAETHGGERGIGVRHAHQLIAHLSAAVRE